MNAQRYLQGPSLRQSSGYEDEQSVPSEELAFVGG